MEPNKGFIHFLMNPKKWWIPLTLIFVISFTGVGFIGYETYFEAPPIPDYRNESGELIFSHDEILQGQTVFQRYGPMDFGSLFGDGANRGPDFTAQALHQVTMYVNEYYSNQPDLTKLAWLGVQEQARREIRENKYLKSSNEVSWDLSSICRWPITTNNGTYLTVNHGHAALMGVYGNLSIAAVLFCCKLLTKSTEWRPGLARLSFWSINSGLMLMVLLDLFPAGLLQFEAVVDQGLWFARSETFTGARAFQTLTWMRIIGGSIFTLGGVIPLVTIVVKTVRNLKSVRSTKVPATSGAEIMV